MPGAVWRPVANKRVGGMAVPILGMVVHHTVGSLESAEARFNDTNTDDPASAHFGVDDDGAIIQWVDTNDAAYHACQANYTGWVGVEHRTPAEGEGDVWAPLTPSQVASSGKILAWLHDTHGAPVQVTDDPSLGGVAYHSMHPGPCATHWGITGCPGSAIVAQRAAIVAAASTPPQPSPLLGDPMIYQNFSDPTKRMATLGMGYSDFDLANVDPAHVTIISNEAYSALKAAADNALALLTKAATNGAGTASGASSYTVKLSGTATPA